MRDKKSIGFFKSIKGKIIYIIGSLVVITFLIIGLIISNFSKNEFTKNELNILESTDKYKKSEIEKLKNPFRLSKIINSFNLNLIFLYGNISIDILHVIYYKI